MGTIVVLDLMGGVALLHMVRSGVLRAFGPDQPPLSGPGGMLV
jgi:hypothetical protein